MQAEFNHDKLNYSNDFVDRIKVAQETDEEVQGFPLSFKKVKKGKDETISFDGRLCLPSGEELKNEVL